MRLRACQLSLVILAGCLDATVDTSRSETDAGVVPDSATLPPRDARSGSPPWREADAALAPDPDAPPIPHFDGPDLPADAVGIVEDCVAQDATTLELAASTGLSVDVTLEPAVDFPTPLGHGDARSGAWLQVRAPANEAVVVLAVAEDGVGTVSRRRVTTLTWYPSCAAARLGVGTDAAIRLDPGHVALLRVDNVYAGAVIDPIAQLVRPARNVTLTTTPVEPDDPSPSRTAWLGAQFDAERGLLRIRGLWSRTGERGARPPPGLWIPLYDPPFGGALAVDPTRLGDAGLLSMQARRDSAGDVVTAVWALSRDATIALSALAAPTVLIAPDPENPMAATLRPVTRPEEVAAGAPCDPESVATHCPPELHCAPGDEDAGDTESHEVEYRCRPPRACPPEFDLDGRPILTSTFVPVDDGEPTTLRATLSGQTARLHLRGCGDFEAPAEYHRVARLDTPLSGLWRISAISNVHGMRIRRTCDALVCDRWNADSQGGSDDHIDLELQAGESVWVFAGLNRTGPLDAAATLTATHLPDPGAAIRDLEARFEPEIGRLSIDAAYDGTEFLQDAARFELVDAAGESLGLEHVLVSARPHTPSLTRAGGRGFAVRGFARPDVARELGGRWSRVRMRFRPFGSKVDLVAEAPLVRGLSPVGVPFLGDPTLIAERWPGFGAIRLAAEHPPGAWGGEAFIAPLDAAGHATDAPVPVRIGTVGECAAATIDARYLPDDSEAWRAAVGVRVVRGTGPDAARPESALDLPVRAPAPVSPGARCGAPTDGRCEGGHACGRRDELAPCWNPRPESDFATRPDRGSPPKSAGDSSPVRPPSSASRLVAGDSRSPRSSKAADPKAWTTNGAAPKGARPATWKSGSPRANLGVRSSQDTPRSGRHGRSRPARAVNRPGSTPATCAPGRSPV